MGQKNALYFCAGLAIGILGTLGFLWFYQGPEPEKLEPCNEPRPKPVEEELEPCNEPQPKRHAEHRVEVEPVEHNVNYSRLIHMLQYDGSEQSIEDKLVPYQITEEQYADYGEGDIYDETGLTLYSDGIIADSISDDVVTEAELFPLLGPNFTVPILMRMFTQSSSFKLPDMVYVRNERLFSQYEISYDERTYREVTGRNDDGSY